MSKKYTEVQVNITMEDFTGWAMNCSIEEAKELAIKSLIDNIEGHLIVRIDKESLGKETKEFEHVEIKESEWVTHPKIKIIHNWFIPWIFEGYDQGDMLEAWGCGGTIEEHAIGIAGLIPIQHIQNWEEIKHYYDKKSGTYTMPDSSAHRVAEFLEGTEFNSLLEYYEDDGYVEYIPDELEIEWVYKDE